MGVWSTRNLPAGLIPANAQPQYWKSIPSVYNAAVPIPLGIYLHGTTERWTGVTPGNTGVQVNTTTTASGIVTAINQINGDITITPGWTGGDAEWPMICVAPQLNNTGVYSAGLQAGDVATGVPLIQNIITDLITNLGYNIDTSRIYLLPVSGGTEATYGILADQVINAASRTYKIAAVLGGAMNLDKRSIEQVTGDAPSVRDKFQMSDYVASLLKDIPILACAAQGDSNVQPDQTAGTQITNPRTLAASFQNPANVGTARNFWYCEYDQDCGEAATHGSFYTYPAFTTVFRDWLFQQQRGRVWPTASQWAYKATFTCKQIPGMGADATLRIPYEVSLNDTALKLSPTGAITNATYPEVAFYADTACTIRLPAYRKFHNTTTGAARYIVGLPPGSGINAADVPIYVRCGSSLVTWDTCADGRLANDWRHRLNVDFSDGTTVNPTNYGLTVYPDKWSVLTSGRDPKWTVTGAPSSTTSPIGGAMVGKKTTNKYATKGNLPWWAESATLSTKARPFMAALLFRANVTPTSDQTLFALAAASGSNPVFALYQSAAQAAKLVVGGTTTLVAPSTIATVASGNWNTIVGREIATNSRTLQLNPSDGTGIVSDVTDLSAVQTTPFYLGVGVQTISTLPADGDFAKLIVVEFVDPGADYGTAIDYVLRNANAYTVSAFSAVTTTTTSPTLYGSANQILTHPHWKRRHRTR